MYKNAMMEPNIELSKWYFEIAIIKSWDQKKTMLKENSAAYYSVCDTQHVVGAYNLFNVPNPIFLEPHIKQNDWK